jgi:hypothetical protein
VSGYNNNQSDSFDDFERQEHGGGGGLRRQLEETLAEVKELRKQLNQREAKDTDALFKDKGLDPALKELIPEGAEPSEWIDKYAHLLGVKGKERDSAPADSLDDPEIVAPVEDDPALVAEREALAQINGAADAGSSAHITGDVLERMNKIDSEDELMKFFNSNGAAQ